ncbi:LOW QUALITY PROTEIN: serine protease SPPA, chloroplastic [Rhodamnia argentea]|uniref:LOW QUALITY PROTEIN: serine protease SPPA, chloroplastic n=1 Tax=Rhodamnia argentea TaxID=178133 RepID=A0A8B8NGL1_9MYRT|nr:LOW QUALITY PROTEIN: serine protease SPPA, chloroplastic [Rhodamnia argentea]
MSSSSQSPPSLPPSLPSPYEIRLSPPHHSFTLKNNLSFTHCLNFIAPATHHKSFSIRAFDDSGSETETQKQEREQETKEQESHAKKGGDYPSGEFEFEEFGVWKKFGVKLKMLVAFPWERVKKGSVLTMKLRGQISDQLKSRFSSGLSLPQICENFVKAAYDPRISGIYLHIDSLNCGWGKVQEIRRHILNFKKSGKFIVGYVPTCQEKEYYLACACEELYAPPSAYFSLYGLTVQASFFSGVLEKVGIEPQVERIGKYKSAGDQLTRKSMSEENCEMLTTILDNVYGSWIDEVSSTKGKKREDIEKFINEGVFQVERLKKEGFITDICYDDEVITMLKEKLGVQPDKNLPLVDYRRYSRARKWTLGLSGGKDLIAVIRASGAITRVKSPTSLPSSSGVIAEQIIEKIQVVRESKRFKAAIIRIDSPGGDALASDLMWREIRLLAASKPVIASMVDVAASGGYYMAMGTPTIVAESLTLTGSIGVVTGKLNLGNLYEKIGFNKEIVSRGKYAELLAAEQRPFRPDEAELFAKMANNAYKMFRDKAAFSRSMPVDKMEEVAQGRVWTGNDAASRGLVDAIGGFSRAVAIAKERANIPQTNKVTLVELSRPSPSLPEILSGIGGSLVGVDTALKEMLRELTFSEGVQVRMDGILYERLEGASFANPILTMIRDYLSSL